MAFLLYRTDMDEVRERMRTFWRGGDIGRPALLLTCPRAEPLEPLELLPEPAGWVTDYSTSDFDYRVHLSRRDVASRCYFGEAVPCMAPDLAPNCLALYLGCRGVEMPGTVWCEPFITDPDADPKCMGFRHDPENFYWRFSTRLGAEQVRSGEGRWLVQFPDLIEGLDTLAAMRGAERLLLDLHDRPEWVRSCLRRITDLYFRHYDVFFELFKDEVGGSVYWAWTPGRMAKLQCDFSAMIGPATFGDLMVPVLTEMTERVSHSMYHWDGPGAIPHHDHILAIPRLDMIQWTPGAGHAPPQDPQWWPLYHKSIDAGKKLFIGEVTVDGLGRLKREFGTGLKRFLIGMSVSSEREAGEAIAEAQV